MDGGELADDLDRRLETARREVEMSGDYDYVVVNDDVGACVGRLRQIILAERSSVEAMGDTVRAIAETFRPLAPRAEGK